MKIDKYYANNKEAIFSYFDNRCKTILAMPLQY